MKTIMIDLDGVLADFTEGFTRIANKLWGHPIVLQKDQIEWRMPFCTNHQQDIVWEEIRTDPRWWVMLNRMVALSTMFRIEALQRMHEILFVTSRVSNASPPGEQSRRWLRMHGVPNASVIVSSEKGAVARAVGATHSLEDRLENALDIAGTQPNTYLINRPYNQVLTTELSFYPIHKLASYEYITRVDTVDQFLDKVEGLEVRS